MEEQIDLIGIQQKWQEIWAKNHAFEPKVSDKKKFFLTFPYPYVNGLPHIGHMFTLMRVEALARYKRHNDFNVLWPQGWHCTGSPIVNAAKRIAEGEAKQTKIMRDMGISEEELPKFRDPEYWIEYFPKEYKKDVQSVGFSIDWRREFITTSLNPYYDKFIKWQFNKLKEGNYVIKGKFPVVWCEKCNNAVGDHSRSEGEGETTQEFTLLKFKYNNSFIIAATLRPETIFGQTNLWVGADIEYVKADVDDEEWIMSKECADKLENQDKNVKITGKVMGKELIGKYVKAPGIDRELIILPSYFCKPDKGTGIVTSVPSDAPDDYIGLRDLQTNEAECKKYGLDQDKIKEIKPIAIIDSADLGNMAAVKVVEDMKIKNQKQRDLLENAKKLVYKKGFYEGVMNKECGKYSGMPVTKAKDKVKAELIKNKQADVLYELTGKVVCRCLTQSVVKIVSDQWFLNYGDEDWKKKAHKCLAKMKLYPEKARQQFEYVIDWLHEWACTREEGLGTRLPWDQKWLIESLSDSTIYMAFYTIVHKLKKIPTGQVDDKLFDYVLLGRGEKPDIEGIDDLKKEFDYWYPVDFRNSGKDLIQNHLTFFIFNHVAIFPEDKWPKGIGANGWVTVDGQKMSKSLGNMIPVKKMVKEFSADVSRITILNGGEEMDDPNWDSKFAKSMKTKLANFYTFAVENYGKGGDNYNAVDAWVESRLNQTIIDATKCMEDTMFRTAIQTIYFEMQSVLRWYMRRTKTPNKELMNKVIEAMVIMLEPFTPHICAEIWEKLGKENAHTASWPVAEESKINPKLDMQEEMVKTLITDINTVMKLAKIEKASKVTVIVSPKWKYELFKMIRGQMEKTRNPGEILKAIIATDLKQYGKEISKMVPMIVKNQKLPRYITSQEEDTDVLKQSIASLEKEFGCQFDIVLAEDSKEAKARNAAPSKPALLVE